MRRAFSLRDIYCSEDALRHPDGQVRIAAIHHAAAGLAPGQSLPALLRERLTDDDPAVARYALIALVQAGVSEVFEVLVETLRRMPPGERPQWHKDLRNCSRFPLAILLDDVCGLEMIGPGADAGRGKSARPAGEEQAAKLWELVRLSPAEFVTRAQDASWREAALRRLTAVKPRENRPRRCYHGVVLRAPLGHLPGFVEAEDMLFQFCEEALVNGPACAAGREALFTAAREDPEAMAGVVLVLEDRPPRSEPARPAFTPRPAGLVPGIVAEPCGNGRYAVWCADGEFFSEAFAEGDAALGRLVLAESAPCPQRLRAHPFGEHLLDAETVRTWTDEHRQRRYLENSMGMRLARIPPGEFLMGSPLSEAGRRTDELQHRVKISKPFYLGVYAVTQAEYQRVMGKNPSWFSATGGGKAAVAGLDTSRFPVENVSWKEAVEFCRRLSGLPGERAAGAVYRLPTEAEWEYACRAGTTTSFHFGETLNGREGNCDGNRPYGTSKTGPCLGRPTEVGSYVANAFGLCDMHGNVSEWCADWYHGSYYDQFAGAVAVDPSGPAQSSDRVERGGSWRGDASDCRAACRCGWFGPGSRRDFLGFRLARAVS